MRKTMRTAIPFGFGLALAALLAAATAMAEEIVATHYGALLTSAPIAVAMERGEFTKRGVDITAVISTTGGATATTTTQSSGSASISIRSATATTGSGSDRTCIRAIISRITGSTTRGSIACPRPMARIAGSAITMIRC